jgi:hypothetical protein
MREKPLRSFGLRLGRFTLRLDAFSLAHGSLASLLWFLGHDVLELGPERFDRGELVADLCFVIDLPSAAAFPSSHQSSVSGTIGMKAYSNGRLEGSVQLVDIRKDMLEALLTRQSSSQSDHAGSRVAPMNRAGPDQTALTMAMSAMSASRCCSKYDFSRVSAMADVGR